MSAVTKNARDGILKVVDGATTPDVYTIQFAEADFTYNDPTEDEEVAITDRQGKLAEVKAPAPFGGFGTFSFTAKYTTKVLKEKLTSPAVSTAVEADKIDEKLKCVNLVLEFVNAQGEPVETHTLYNCRIPAGSVVYNDGDEFSTFRVEGRILGKMDGTERKFTNIE